MIDKFGKGKIKPESCITNSWAKKRWTWAFPEKEDRYRQLLFAWNSCIMHLGVQMHIYRKTQHSCRHEPSKLWFLFATEATNLPGDACLFLLESLLGVNLPAKHFFFPGLASDSVEECVLVASEKILEWKPPEHTLIAEIVQSSVNSCFFP